MFFGYGKLFIFEHKKVNAIVVYKKNFFDILGKLGKGSVERCRTLYRA